MKKLNGKRNYLIATIFAMLSTSYFIKPTDTNIENFTFTPIPVRLEEKEQKQTEHSYDRLEYTVEASEEIIVINKNTEAVSFDQLIEWTGNIPQHYGDGSGCSREQSTIVANKMWDAKADDETVEWMLGVMSRESTCDPTVYNGNLETRDNSWGLCQINALAGFFKSDGLLGHYNPELFAVDFAYNADACVELWTLCGRGPWNYGNYYCDSPFD